MENEEVINNRYETEYNVYLFNGRVAKVAAKKIVITKEDITFYDYYGCVSGSFKKDFITCYMASSN